MKLYATTTSERASKGQGGNKFLDIEIRDDNKEIIAKIVFKPIVDSVGDGIIYSAIFNERLMQVSPTQFLEISKGKQKKDEHEHVWIQKYPFTQNHSLYCKICGIDK